MPESVVFLKKFVKWSIVAMGRTFEYAHFLRNEQTHKTCASRINLFSQSSFWISKTSKPFLKFSKLVLFQFKALNKTFQQEISR